MSAGNTYWNNISQNGSSVGVSVNPKSWTSDYRPLQVEKGAFIAGRNADTTQMFLGANAYHNGGWKYLNDGFASRHYFSDGEQHFQSAASGTAEAAITWLNGISIGADANTKVHGKLGVGGDAGTARLTVTDTGTSKILIHETGTSPYVASLELSSQVAGTYGALVHYTSAAERLTLQNYGRTVSAASSNAGSIAFKTKLNNTTPIPR